MYLKYFKYKFIKYKFEFIKYKLNLIKHYFYLELF